MKTQTKFDLIVLIFMKYQGRFVYFISPYLHGPNMDNFGKISIIMATKNLSCQNVVVRYIYITLKYIIYTQ